MTDIYFTGIIVMLVVHAAAAIVIVLFAMMDADSEILRLFAPLILSAIVLPWVWPAIAPILVVAGLIWCVYTTARIIKHKDVSF